jgi:hypothetical protein
MSALPPKADIRRRDQDVCFGPISDIANSASGGCANATCARSLRTRRVLKQFLMEITLAAATKKNPKLGRRLGLL